MGTFIKAVTADIDKNEWIENYSNLQAAVDEILDMFWEGGLAHESQVPIILWEMNEFNLEKSYAGMLLGIDGKDHSGVVIFTNHVGKQLKFRVEYIFDNDEKYVSTKVTELLF